MMLIKSIPKKYGKTIFNSNLNLIIKYVKVVLPSTHLLIVVEPDNCGDIHGIYMDSSKC